MKFSTKYIITLFCSCIWLDCRPIKTKQPTNTNDGYTTTTLPDFNRSEAYTSGKSKNYDTTFSPFEDTTYKVHFHASGNFPADEDFKNALLVFYRQVQGKTDTIIKDSLSCINPEISFSDFNCDNVKDLLIFHSAGARANLYYYLYILDPKNKRMRFVENFNKLANPSLDSLKNIITSVGMSSSNYYSFYRINERNRLINLGHSFEEKDTTQYDKTINAIRSDQRRIK